MNWPLGGLCGLTPRRRRQPRGGATRVESAFPTKGEVPTERGCRRHAMAVGALVPPDAARVVKLASQQCTQMPRNGAERPDPPICVHYCDPKATHNPSPQHNSVHKRPETAPRSHFGQSVYTPASSRLSATAPQSTVYTNAPIRRGEARSSHLCTLLRSPGHSQPKPTAQQCTQTPQNGVERPFWPICVHSCAPTTARVTGRGYRSHDVDGPMAPVMPGRLDLRPTPPER